MEKASPMDYSAADKILKLLTDDEVAKVSTAESAAKLSDGDEYIDLENLAGGVQRAEGATTPMGRVLPKSAVQASTWITITALLVPLQA
jgi:hypothetical protein